MDCKVRSVTLNDSLNVTLNDSLNVTLNAVKGLRMDKRDSSLRSE